MRKNSGRKSIKRTATSSPKKKAKKLVGKMDPNNPDAPIRTEADVTDAQSASDTSHTDDLSNTYSLSSDAEDIDMTDADFKRFMIKQVLGINNTLQRLDTKFDKLSKKVNKNTENIGKVKKDFSSLRDTVKSELTDIKKDIETLKPVKDQMQQNWSQDNVLYIKNLSNQNEDTPEALGTKAKDLFTAIDQPFPEDTTIERTKARQPRERRDGRQPWPPAIRVQLPNAQAADAVLKAKAALKGREGYEEVYIERARMPHERRYEANMRMMARAFPNLEYKKGRLQQKQD